MNEKESRMTLNMAMNEVATQKMRCQRKKCEWDLAKGVFDSLFLILGVIPRVVIEAVK